MRNRSSSVKEAARKVMMVLSATSKVPIENKIGRKPRGVEVKILLALQHGISRFHATSEEKMEFRGEEYRGKYDVDCLTDHTFEVVGDKYFRRVRSAFGVSEKKSVVHFEDEMARLRQLTPLWPFTSTPSP